MKKSRRLRVKVKLRPKQRSRRNRLFVAVVAVLFAGAAAVVTLRHLAAQIGNPLVYLRNSVSPSFVSVTISAPQDSVRQAAEAAVAAKGRLSPAAQAAAIKEGLPYVKAVAVRRDWLRRRARLELSLRSAAAAAELRGKPAGYLSDEGVVFAAPEGLYNVTQPVVETSGADAADLALAARIARAAGAPAALPSPLRSLRWLSPREGWQAQLEDGTAVLWGDGRWTKDKLSRLREILADAKSQPGTPARFVADMRYFEDGRVLLRPLTAPRSVSLR